MKEKFPKNYSILLSGPPGVGKFEYCLHLTKYYLGIGENVIFITTERSPFEIKTRAKDSGLDLDKYEGRNFMFVDCFSWSVETKYDKGLVLDEPTNLSELILFVEKAGDKLGKQVRIIFDSLSPLFLRNSTEKIMDFFQVMNSRIKSDYGFILYTIQDGVHNPMIMNTLIYLVDGYLQMEFQDGELLERKLRVHHLKGLSYDTDWVKFKIVDGKFTRHYLAD